MKTSVKNFQGKLLKELIKRKGISQEKVAAEIGVSTQTISYWIKGKKKPSTFNLEMLSIYFDVPQICFTEKFPLCSNENYEKMSEKLKEELRVNMFEEIIFNPIDKSTKLLYDYLIIISEKYNTFNYDLFDKGVINDMSIIYIIKNILDNKIEECFIELGIIQKGDEENYGTK